MKSDGGKEFAFCSRPKRSASIDATYLAEVLCFQREIPWSGIDRCRNARISAVWTSCDRLRGTVHPQESVHAIHLVQPHALAVSARRFPGEEPVRLGRYRCDAVRSSKRP